MFIDGHEDHHIRGAYIKIRICKACIPVRILLSRGFAIDWVMNKSVDNYLTSTV